MTGIWQTTSFIENSIEEGILLGQDSHSTQEYDKYMTGIWQASEYEIIGLKCHKSMTKTNYYLGQKLDKNMKIIWQEYDKNMKDLGQNHDRNMTDIWSSLRKGFRDEWFYLICCYFSL